jgi:CRISPR/Cas system CSM-associated protein Csm4 (group 5 of RAMP superfamily)
MKSLKEIRIREDKNDKYMSIETFQYILEKELETEIKKLETEIIYYKSEKIRKPHNIFATRKNMRINKVIQLKHGEIQALKNIVGEQI